MNTVEIHNGFPRPKYMGEMKIGEFAVILGPPHNKKNFEYYGMIVMACYSLSYDNGIQCVSLDDPNHVWTFDGDKKEGLLVEILPPGTKLELTAGEF